MKASWVSYVNFHVSHQISSMRNISVCMRFDRGGIHVHEGLGTEVDTAEIHAVNCAQLYLDHWARVLVLSYCTAQD